MSDIKDLTNKIKQFRDERNWSQFHNHKDMALSLVLEAAEVLEHFQWKNNEKIEEYIKAHKDDIGEELVDVLYWVLLMANDLDLDITKAFDKKMEKNSKKYPIDKSKGSAAKYNQL